MTPKIICKGHLWIRAQNSHSILPLTDYMLKYKTECEMIYK